MTEAKRLILSHWEWASFSKALFISAFLWLMTNISANAKGVDIKEIIRSICPKTTSIEKKTLLLSKEQAKAIMDKAHMKLPSKIVRLYLAKNGTSTLCYGIILSRKVRTKKAAILYMISPEGTIQTIEILAFAEPPEFIPKREWMLQFRGKSISDPLRVGRDIPTITGATLSARNVTDGARLALAIFDIIIRKH